MKFLVFREDYHHGYIEQFYWFSFNIFDRKYPRRISIRICGYPLDFKQEIKRFI